MHKNICIKKTNADDAMKLIKWSGYNLQTSCKMRTILHISGSTNVENFKLFQMYMHNKRLTQMTSSNCSDDLCKIYRPATQRGPDYISQVLTFKLIWMYNKGMKNNFLFKINEFAINLLQIFRTSPEDFFQMQNFAI